MCVCTSRYPMFSSDGFSICWPRCVFNFLMAGCLNEKNTLGAISVFHCSCTPFPSGIIKRKHIEIHSMIRNTFNIYYKKSLWAKKYIQYKNHIWNFNFSSTQSMAAMVVRYQFSYPVLFPYSAIACVSIYSNWTLPSVSVNDCHQWLCQVAVWPVQ